jgi:hypothetical protein
LLRSPSSCFPSDERRRQVEQITATSNRWP